MPLDTTLAGVGIFQPPSEAPESTSFLRAFERAQERSSPLYQLKLQEAAKGLQQMGMAMKREELLYGMDVLKKQEMLQGMETVGQMAEARAKVTDLSDPSWLAEQYSIFARKPSKAGADALADAERTHKDALTARDRSEAIKARIKAAEISAGKGTSPQRNAAILTQLQRDLETAQRSADPVTIQEAQRALDNFMVFGPQAETTTITTPEGTTVTTQRGAPGSAEKTAAQKRISAAEETYSQLQNTLAQITPDTVGPAGVLREHYETLANIVRPGSVRPTTTEARQNMRIAFQQLLASFRSEAIGGRMTNQEMNMLKNIGDVTQLLESPDTARTSLNVLMQLEAGRTVRASKQLKRAAPDWALRTMTYPQLVAGHKAGWITDDEAKRAFDLNPSYKLTPQ